MPVRVRLWAWFDSLRSLTTGVFFLEGLVPSESSEPRDSSPALREWS
ncbi:MAG: hypothetical protein J5J00_08530 [Deltaproteobacteria bacterium]|nr:hypothetical protein [Deltaproteobacteria bacterium]